MSSKFLERLDEIHEGAPARMGFGPARSAKAPGMALVLLVSGDHQTGAATASGLAPDAVIVSGIGGPDQTAAIKDSLSKLSWGVLADSLSSSDAQAYRNNGCDLLAFRLPGTALGAVFSDDSARVLCVDPDSAHEDLRDINALPVDAVLVPLTGISADWTLEDLARLARVTGRTNKYVLAEVSEAPNADSLKVLRNAGVNGLMLNVSLGEDAIKALQEDLTNMPRPGADRRGRSNAILPGAVYTAASQPGRTPDEPDEDD
jgi:hypothetical protein